MNRDLRKSSGMFVFFMALSVGSLILFQNCSQEKALVDSVGGNFPSSVSDVWMSTDPAGLNQIAAIAPDVSGNFPNFYSNFQYVDEGGLAEICVHAVKLDGTDAPNSPPCILNGAKNLGAWSLKPLVGAGSWGFTASGNRYYKLNQGWLQTSWAYVDCYWIRSGIIKGAVRLTINPAGSATTTTTLQPPSGCALNPETYYLDNNLDVKNNVNSGLGYLSGYDHWCQFGHSETRTNCFPAYPGTCLNSNLSFNVSSITSSQSAILTWGSNADSSALSCTGALAGISSTAVSGNASVTFGQPAGSYTCTLTSSKNAAISSSGAITLGRQRLVKSAALTVTQTTTTTTTTMATATTTTTTIMNSVNICSDSNGCGSIVGLLRELDGRTSGVGANSDTPRVNATAACQKVLGPSVSLQSFQTSAHSISCGGGYGLGEWDAVNNNFTWNNFGICYTGTVTVISSINCLSTNVMPVIQSAGPGCADNYCIWIFGNKFANSVAVEVSDQAGSFSARYMAFDLSYNPSATVTFNGMQGQSLTFGLKDGSAERTTFCNIPLNVKIINLDSSGKDTSYSLNYLVSPPYRYCDFGGY